MLPGVVAGPAAMGIPGKLPTPYIASQIPVGAAGRPVFDLAALLPDLYHSCNATEESGGLEGREQGAPAATACKVAERMGSQPTCEGLAQHSTMHLDAAVTGNSGAHMSERHVAVDALPVPESGSSRAVGCETAVVGDAGCKAAVLDSTSAAGVADTSHPTVTTVQPEAPVGPETGVYTDDTRTIDSAAVHGGPEGIVAPGASLESDKDAASSAADMGSKPIGEEAVISRAAAADPGQTGTAAFEAEDADMSANTIAAGAPLSGSGIPTGVAGNLSSGQNSAVGSGSVPGSSVIGRSCGNLVVRDPGSLDDAQLQHVLSSVFGHPCFKAAAAHHKTGENRVRSSQEQSGCSLDACF